MTRTGAPSLTAEDWDGLYASGRVIAKVIGDGERRLVHSRLSLARGMRAVDLGCGTGKWTQQLAAWGLDTVGLDFSEVALEQACAAVGRARYGLWDVDSAAVPGVLAAGSVDIVSCRLSFSFFDRSRLLPNVRWWLAPQGRLYILTDVTDQHAAEPRPHECVMSKEEVASLGGDDWHVLDTFRLGRRTGIVLQPSCSSGQDPSLLEVLPATAHGLEQRPGYAVTRQLLGRPPPAPRAR
ncbi:class I SAM-dependent methyltransferase [Streptomyces sp. NPDC058861]|uniref:class I SAM-dependent methyltransferase n=1 Tax=Streptomyces sp. NPDC058861 TaxID=3346653 RepID=UPI0036A5137D